jgi:hypothetical protein
MTTVGPWDPQVETLPEYLDRVVHSAPRPNPEQLARLAALLRSGRTRRAPGFRPAAQTAGDGR